MVSVCVCVCVCADRGSSVSPQTAQCVFKGSSGQSCHTQWDNNRMCYVHNTNSFLPTLRGWCHLVYHFFFIHTYLFIILFLLTKRQEILPLEKFFKKKKKRNKKIKTTHPIDLAPRHMDIPCLSSIKNNFGKLWINTFPVTCWRGEGRQHDHSNRLISLWLHAMHSSHGPSLRVNWGIHHAHCSPTQFWEKDTDLQITDQTLAGFKWRWRE